MREATLFPKDTTHMPLAERMRPRDFDEFYGQDEVVGKGKPLRNAVEKDVLQSIILWGPPGTGKTTLARIIAEKTGGVFIHFSAATMGVPELKQIVKEAEERRRFNKKRTILFVDEIHRFNKTQQSAFLPSLEDGTVVLVGATTENPSFEIIAPLLSRSLVLVLQSLDDKALGNILDGALKNGERGFGREKIAIDEKAREVMIGFADGDARVLLNTLEFAVHNTAKTKGTIRLDAKNIQDILQKKAIRYDKNGEEHYNVISAFIKSMRDSDPDGALYWLSRMIEAGENARFIARRMVIFASEDIGVAQPTALVVANAVAHAVEYVGMPEAAINLTHGVVHLATAKKSNASYKGLLAAMEDVKEHGALPVPLHLRNAVTKLTKDLGYHKGYKYAHDYKNSKVSQEHLPEKLKGRKYYEPPE
ncbi:MAG: AAA family ATPase [Candidatus Sungbacteria bacterium RIFCSPLOWO2_02_FULL_51_17]|nr:MAG: AAA family ATPase [Candidatus Sungbacteria bacterium RIFCSPHIGHO2_01_FULL_51_22]OHA06399.1 MAG: AAA family ATPase [Candidatus Sungbacteria bacterium RIFCSPLOWO2_01_FULL_51_34]OHA10555.1 MAG: AAA family ATPase [Candidatus Sungbacteria bacterium RIFCSPLOWO2_02_FULL_51_17]